MKAKLHIWLKIIFTTLCLLFSCFLLLSALPQDGEEKLDPEYAKLHAADETISKTYSIDECDTLWFCYAAYSTGNKRTLFSNSVPNIKIINDGGNYVELTTNRSIHDAVSIVVENRVLKIDFQDEFYNPVYVDDVNYDYDMGLYVDCTAFDITIHAPIHDFRTNTQTVLDFHVAKASEVYLDFSFEGTKANIHDIHADELTFYCSGDSEVTLSGTVKGRAKMSIWHNTRVDATQLEAGEHYTQISSQILGWSYIELPAHPMFDPFGIGTIISLILTVAPIYWLIRDIRLIRKLWDRKKH